MRLLGGPRRARCAPFKTRLTHPDAAADKWSPQARCLWHLVDALITDAVMDSPARCAVLSPQNRISERPRRPTAGASAAGVLRPTTQQAKHDNLTATPLAGLTNGQCTTSANSGKSARHTGWRRGKIGRAHV